MPGVDLFTQLGASAWMTTDASRLQHALQRARFDVMGVASRRALAGDLAGGNAEVKTLLDGNPQMRGWCVIHPVFPERSSEEMRRYLSNPKWLGAVLHPGRTGESLASGATREVLNAYRRYTKPVLVHVADEEAVRQLEQLAAEFNGIKFIASGAGGDDWQACMYAAKRTVNIFLEPFSGGAHRGKVEAMVGIVGGHRVLFASNYPEYNPGAALGTLLDAKITDAEKQSVLTGNANRLFGFNRQPVEPEA
ncbi:MAG TPA: amidohydrolase family protein [Armatimonadota bacterium]|nr:amidohydrolase family protein [Armatimonadota bacterium]